jgi:Domain of unknown function (DUF4118)
MSRSSARHVNALVLLAAVLAPVAVAAAVLPWRGVLLNANVALVLVVVVVAVAATGHRLAAAVSAVSAGGCFDFFYTRPYGSFAITNRNDVETTGLLLVVGLVVGELAARSRRSRTSAAQGRSDVNRIFSVSQMVAAGTPAETITAAVAEDLTEMLFLRSCRFDRQLGSRNLPRLERDGEVNLGGVRWEADTMGLPGEMTLLVEHRGTTVGRFVLVPTPAKPVSLERRVVAVALADQVGAALTGHADRWLQRPQLLAPDPGSTPRQ